MCIKCWWLLEVNGSLAVWIWDPYTCCFGPFPDCVYTTLVPVLLSAFYGIACGWDLLLLLWTRLTAEALLFFSFFFPLNFLVTSLVTCLTLASSDFLPSCTLQNFAYSNHGRNNHNWMQLCPPVGILWIAYCCLHPMSTAVQYGQCAPKSKCMHWLVWLSRHSCPWHFTRSLWRCFTSTHLRLILFGCSTFCLTRTSPHMCTLHVFGTQHCLQKKLERRQVELKFIEILTSHFVFCWFSSE